jgi:septum formation protein
MTNAEQRIGNSEQRIANTERRLMLGSASPRRIGLMRWLEAQFETHAPVIDEGQVQLALASTPPEEIAVAISRAKAEAVVTRFPEAVVVTADTLVICQGEILGKPTDENDAQRMLYLLAGRSHQVITGVVVASGDAWLHGAMTTEVTMRAASTSELEAYVGTGEAIDKAGAYGIQGQAATLVERVEGCYLNVVGFPLCVVSALLSEIRVVQVADPVALCVRAAYSITQSAGRAERQYDLSPHPSLSATALPEGQ